MKCTWHACVQFQGMLWRLLGHALDLSNPESDTLIEEALRLLVSVLNNATAFMPALQVRHLLSHIADILTPKERSRLTGDDTSLF